MLFFSMLTTVHAKAVVSNLRTEYKVNPLGIDTESPRLSWEIISNDRGWTQSAYQIQVAQDESSLAKEENLLWDSGIVVSGQSLHIAYNGIALVSAQRVYWRVRVRDQYNKLSGWSKLAFWEMALLKEADWQAKWIQPGQIGENLQPVPCPFIRKEFRIKSKVNSARIYATSLGLYELYVNGRSADDQVFTPGWTSYNKWLQYQTYDITPLLKDGNNAVGVILGDGWYRGRIGWEKKGALYGNELGLLLQMHIRYQDGTEEVIVSDQTWKYAAGPIIMSGIYDGEIYDARLEMPGWNEAGFTDESWKQVLFADHPKNNLSSPPGPPVRKTAEIKPIRILKTPGHETVFDMGQNMVGWVRLKVQGPAGTMITLKHAEVLDKKGNFYTDNLRSAKQTVQYTLKGRGVEIYEPHFTFQGFRYVILDGFPGTPDLDALTGVVIHSDMTPTGNFTCSNDMINQLQHNIQWGQKGNFVDVPTDCPQRDERMGWTGDAQVFARTGCFNFDAASFYTKWLKDLRLDQFENGAIPHVIPDVLRSGASAAWADAGVIVPWTVYLCYGDKRILEHQYESMKGWVEYIRTQAGETCLWNNGYHFGDWLAFNTERSDYPGATTDKDLITTAYFARSTDLLQRAARILGRLNDAEDYGRLLDQIKTAFQREFVTPNGRLSSNTQTAYALALAFDLLPESVRALTAERLAKDVRNFGHITSGFVGTPLVCHTLTRFGYLNEAYMLLNRKDYPSWLYPITRGATTIWERWDGIKPDSSFQDPNMNSFNHYAYGAIGEWLYQTVAGLDVDESNPGYRHIIFQPHPGGGLNNAHATLQSMYGLIEAEWRISGDRFTYRTVIPPNTTATIHLPGATLENVREGGKSLKNIKEVISAKEENNSLIIEAGSGSYLWDYPKSAQ